MAAHPGRIVSTGDAAYRYRLGLRQAPGGIRAEGSRCAAHADGRSRQGRALAACPSMRLALRRWLFSCRGRMREIIVALTTRLCEALSISAPVVSAPVGQAGPALVAAVSGAGGLGLYGATWRRLEDIAAVASRVREMTDRPFGLNMVLKWDMRERVQAGLDAGVRVFSFTYGVAADLNDLVHEAGGVVLHTVATVEEAEQVVRAGADVVVAQGWEAGGHVRSPLAALPMVPAVVDAVGPVPVVLAGGVADGRGLAAALCLGAAGVWLGTRFLASREAEVHPVYRDRLLAATGSDTQLTTAFDIGWEGTHRVLRNATLDAWEQAGRPAGPDRPGEGDVVARQPRKSGGKEHAWPRYDITSPTDAMVGDIDQMALYAGQSVQLISRSQPAGEIVRELVEQAERVLVGTRASVL